MGEQNLKTKKILLNPLSVSRQYAPSLPYQREVWRDCIFGDNINSGKGYG